MVGLLLCEVFEDLHEPDAASVVQIVDVLKGFRLLLVGFVIVSVLLNTLHHHVLAHGCGPLESSELKLRGVHHQLTN
jgi:hypothetical protein